MDRPPKSRSGPVGWVRHAAWVTLTLVLVIAVGYVAGDPNAWALPDQAPDYQTVPTLTPTPTSAAPRPTATPTRSQPGPTATNPPPTNTPAPSEPTNTPLPAPPTNTPVPSATPSPPTQPDGQGASCWTLPTPGFSPVEVANLSFQAQSDEYLVVPGQTVHLRLVVANDGTSTARNLRICAPLNPALQRTQPTASQGQVRLEQPGLVADLGDLGAGEEAVVALELDIPVEYPLGGVIEHQAWLFSAAQRASSNLWTWALPPGWLPPTGKSERGGIG